MLVLSHIKRLMSHEPFKYDMSRFFRIILCEVRYTKQAFNKKYSCHQKTLIDFLDT